MDLWIFGSCAHMQPIMQWLYVTSVACSCLGVRALLHMSSAVSRSNLLRGAALSASALSVAALYPQQAAHAAQEGLWPDIDGAIGWKWGGKDRCAPDDAACRDNGQLQNGSSGVSAATLPTTGNAITHRCTFDVEIGGKPAGQLALGLWGERAPDTAVAFSRMCSSTLVLPPLTDEKTWGAQEGPWSWTDAAVTYIDASKSIRIGKVKAPLSLSRRDARELRFGLPPVPPSSDKSAQQSATAAGIVQLRRRNDDGFTFQITTTPAKSSDSEWVSIGQVLNSEGMALLARLDGMPLNKYSKAPLARVNIVASAAVAQ